MSQEQHEERLKTSGRIVAKAWGNEGHKRRPLADPKGALQTEWPPFPESAEVDAVETNDRLVYLSLPPKPAGLSDEQLSSVTGGALSVYCTMWTGQA